MGNENCCKKKDENDNNEIVKDNNKDKKNDKNNNQNEQKEEENINNEFNYQNNQLEEENSFIKMNLINKNNNDSKFYLDIIWIDENVFNGENLNYFDSMKKEYPNIKIQRFKNLEKGFKYILSLEFISVFIIVSGRLYSKYYKKLKENLNKIKCIPINLIFTSEKFKKILENNELDTQQIISYDIQKSINNSFYNSGGVYDNYDEVAKYLNKFNSNFSKKNISKNLHDYSYEGLFTFNYLKTDIELLTPILFKDILTKKKITNEEIIKFNNYLLSLGNEEINYLIEPLSILKYPPIEIVSKYWARIYTIESEFYKEINNKLMNSEIKLYEIYIKTLYFGLESKSLSSDISDKLYRGSIINENEKNQIINNKNNKIIVFSKAFLSFSKELNVALDFLNKNEVKKGVYNVLYELNTLEENEIENYNISNISLKDYSSFENEKEILFLPGSSFEIKDIQIIDEMNICKISLSYIGKFNKDFYEIYNNPQKIKQLTQNNEIINPIMELFFSEKNLLANDNNEIEYLNNGKYILSKIIVNPNFSFCKTKNEYLKRCYNNTIPTFLLKNRYNNNFYMANLFYKINTEKEIFYSNIEFIKKIENPYSLKCVDYFEDNEYYYVIYEYFDETLDSYIKNHKKKNNCYFPINFIHKILSQLNVCLKKMVNINKFHKDIQPGNIYLIYTDEEKNNFDVRLGGFNLSINEEDINYTTCSNFEEDPIFKAPEVLFKGNHSKCDLWSIGQLIYYLYFLKPLNFLFKYKKPNDNDLADLISKLVVEDINSRMSWKEYFSHPFFKKYQ